MAVSYGVVLQKRFAISCVCHNNVFRYFMGISTGESISYNFVYLKLSTFTAMWRNYITKFMERLERSENSILTALRNSLFFNIQCKLYMYWTKLVL